MSVKIFEKQETMTKKTLSPEQKLMKAIYGKPIEEMNGEEKKAAYDKFKRE